MEEDNCLQINSMEGLELILEVEGEAGIKKAQRMLVGKVIAKKALNRAAVKDILSKAWDLSEELSITDLGPNIFLFNFAQAKHATKALADGPWFVMGHLLSLQNWIPEATVNEVSYDNVEFWVQMHGLPLEYMTSSNVVKVAKLLGDIVMIECPYVGDTLMRHFLRVQIMINIKKQLVTVPPAKSLAAIAIENSRRHRKMKGEKDDEVASERQSPDKAEGNPTTYDFAAATQTIPQTNSPIRGQTIQEETDNANFFTDIVQAETAGQPVNSGPSGDKAVDLHENRGKDDHCSYKHTTHEYDRGGGPTLAPPSAMSFISWNCRGLAVPSTIQELQDLRKVKKSSIIFLAETRATKEKVEKLQTKFRFRHSFCINPIGLSGGLCLLWNNSITLEILSHSQNYIHTAITDKRGAKNWDCTFIYANPRPQQRRNLWSNLSALQIHKNHSWCCMSDFNEILSQTEKDGLRPQQQRGMDLFRDFLNDTGLMDLELKGCKFTWSSNPRNGFVTREKLDRVLVNWPWRTCYEHALAAALPQISSYHSPILLWPYPDGTSGSSFKYEAYWEEHPDCAQVIEKGLAKRSR
ncbi:Endonuclease/exonuclease/phosphatase superfamily [Sesbania bispinosa]|nr:Endonuclease/exonuclease/phosphatase superfamily [Sesbania bispinosa]